MNWESVWKVYFKLFQNLSSVNEGPVTFITIQRQGVFLTFIAEQIHSVWLNKILLFIIFMLILTQFSPKQEQGAAVYLTSQTTSKFSMIIRRSVTKMVASNYRSWTPAWLSIRKWTLEYCIRTVCVDKYMHDSQNFYWVYHFKLKSVFLSPLSSKQVIHEFPIVASCIGEQEHYF